MGVRCSAVTALLSLVALALISGCPDDDRPAGDAARSTANTTAAATSSQPVTTKRPPAKPGTFGSGVIKGVVKLKGKPPAMIVPEKRKELPFCKDKLVEHNAVIAKDGKLQDVHIAIASGQLDGAYPTTEPVHLDQQDCVFLPRIMGALVDQKIEIKNSDPTLHNVRARLGKKVLFNLAQPKKGQTNTKSLRKPGIYRIDCDVHTWMRTFIVVTDNPFFAVSGADGSFQIERVPDGEYQLVAWHSRYGRKKKKVEVSGGEVTLELEYSGTEPEPAENKGELNELE